MSSFISTCPELLPLSAQKVQSFTEKPIEHKRVRVSNAHFSRDISLHIKESSVVCLDDQIE